MSQFQQPDQLTERQDGMLRTGQALAAGISKPVFYQFVQSRGLEQAALFHETALFLKAYARRKDKDLQTLVRYAKLLRVEKILRQYKFCS